MANRSDQPGARHARHAVHLPASIRIPDASGGAGDPVPATVIDLSFSGIRLACDLELAVGAEVELSLLSQDEPASGVTVVARRSQKLDAGGYHHGMQFKQAGALLPLLGLENDGLDTQWEQRPPAPLPGQAGMGTLLIGESSRLVRLDHLHCKAQGDLVVEQGLGDALLEVGGALTVRGGVVGGEARCAMKMQLDQVGCAQRTPTTLTLAYLPDEIARVHQRAKAMLERDAAHVETCRQKISDFGGEDGNPSHENREEVMALMFEMQAKEAGIEELTQKIGLLDGLIDRKTLGELRIEGELHPGVRIGVFGDDDRFEAREVIPGPVLIRLDDQRRLVTVSLDDQATPLEASDAFKRCA